MLVHDCKTEIKIDLKNCNSALKLVIIWKPMFLVVVSEIKIKASTFPQSCWQDNEGAIKILEFEQVVSNQCAWWNACDWIYLLCSLFQFQMSRVVGFNLAMPMKPTITSNIYSHVLFEFEFHFGGAIKHLQVSLRKVRRRTEPRTSLTKLN